MMLYLFLTLTFFVAHSVDVWTPLMNESGEVYEGKITGEELSNWHGVQEFGGNNGYTFSDDCQSQGGLKSIKMQCTTFVSSLQLQCEKRRKYTRWSYYSRRYYSSYGSAWKNKRGYGSGKVTEIPATGIIRVEIEADDMVRQVRFYTGESTAFQCGKKTANGKTYSVSAPRGMQLCALRGRSRSFVMKLGAGWCYGKTKAPTRRPWWWRRNYGVRRTTRSPYRRNDRYNYYNRWRYRYRVRRTTSSPYRRNSSSNRYNYYNRWRNRYRVRRTTRKATRRPYWWRSRNTRTATQRPYWWRYRNTRRATQRPYWRNSYYWRNRYSRYSPVITTKSPNRNSRSFYNYYATSVMIDDEKLEIPNIDIQEEEDAVQNDEFNDNEDVEEDQEQQEEGAEENSTPVFGIVGTLMAVGGFLGIAFVYFAKRDNDDVIYEQIPDHNDDDEP